MNAIRRRSTAGITALIVAASAVACRPLAAQGPPEAGKTLPAAPAGNESEIEYLTRGPLHEAFAEPINVNPQPGLIVPKKPPRPIDEIPPEVKPQGDSIWIPGYWTWDVDRKDFIWTSGTWRVPPLGRRWVPGYWTEADGGSQWISGFWAPLETADVQYLPNPPESLEQGPSSPQPSEDYFWVDGCWMYRDGRYAWQAGYWAPGEEGWVWVPNHYLWTPAGSIFVDGYWDYALADRGMCFAPVRFRTALYARSGFRFWPQEVLDLGLLRMHLFVNPRYGHYCFGDWYGRYDRFGIYAPFDFHRRHGYDPLWSYFSWHFGRQGIDYADRVRGWHRYFQSHEDLRPPRTLADQRRFVAGHRDFDHLDQVVLAQNVKDVLSKHPDKVTRLDEEQREQFRRSAAGIEKLVDARARFDATAKVGGESNAPGAPPRRGPNLRLTLPDTPDVERARQTTTGRPQQKAEPRTAFRPELPGRERSGAVREKGGVQRPGGQPDTKARPHAPRRPEPPAPSRQLDLRRPSPQSPPRGAEPTAPEERSPRGGGAHRGRGQPAGVGGRGAELAPRPAPADRSPERSPDQGGSSRGPSQGKKR